MGSKKYFVVLCLYFVLCLLILISSPSTAFSVKISGEQGLSSYRESVDTTIVNASAQSPIHIQKDGTLYPMSCALRNSQYYCNHAFEKATLPGGEYELTFVQESGSPLTTTKSFIVDEDAPFVNLFEVTDLGDGTLHVKYDIQDSAFFYDSSVCSGLDTITISSEESIIYEEKISLPGVCEQEKNDLVLDVEGISGEVSFYMTLTDKLGQSSTTNSNVLQVDYQTPIINDDLTFLLNGETIEYISQNPTVAPYVTVKFSVTEESLESVVADLSSLSRNPSLEQQYKEVVFKCTSIGLKSICQAENILFNPGVSSISIPVTAKDTAGNIIDTIISTNLQLVNKQGEVSYFAPLPDHCDADMCFIKNGVAKFLIQIVGADAGISSQLITLATSELSSIQTTKPTFCNETDPITPIVDCYAYPVVQVGEEETISKRVVLTNPTTDILGTQLSGKTSVVVSIDNNPPTPLSSLNYSVPGCSISGETGTFSIRMQDDVSTKLFISTSTQKITGTSFFENTCKKESDDSFLCELKISDFVSYSEEETIIVQIRDLAGNIYEKEWTLSVCEANNDFPPNFIKQVKPTSIPSVDRRIASIMPVHTYVPLSISSSTNLEIIDIETDNCIQTEFLGSDPYIVSKTGTNPVLVLPLGGSKGTLLPQSIPINCTLYFYERRGDVRFLQAEEEQLHFFVDTYNLMLGEVSSASQEKLDDIGEELIAVRKKINNLETFNSIAKKICDILDGINKIGQVASYARSFILATSIVSDTIVEGSGTALWETLCPPLHQVTKFSMNFWTPGKSGISKFVPGNMLANVASNKLEMTQKGTQTIGMVMKLGCLTYRCGLCSVEGIIQGVSIVKNIADVNSEDTLIGDDAQDLIEERKKLEQEINNYDEKIDQANKNLDILYHERLTQDINKINSYDTQQEINEQQEIISNHILKRNNIENDLPQSKTLDEVNDLFALQFSSASSSSISLDPYKSISNSRSCLCLPGMLYNQQKQEQLLCKEYKCIQESISAGLPYDHCISAYKEGNCLYYKGASKDKFGGVMDFIGSYLGMALESAPKIAHEYLCGQDYPSSNPDGSGNLITFGKNNDQTSKACYTLDNYVGNIKATTCSISGSVLQLKEFNVLKDSFENLKSLFGLGRESEFEKTNYCQGLDFSEEIIS